MSFLKNVGSAIKTGAKKAANATKAGIAHLNAYPTEINCRECGKVVPVPPDRFNWDCDACGIVNRASSKKCGGCQTDIPSNLPPVVITCVMCKHENEVPRSNMRKHARSVADTTKKAAIKTRDAVKAEYAHQKDTPDKFPCGNCQTMLLNPNKNRPQLETLTPEQEANMVAAPILPPEAKEVQCPVCKQITPIPGSNFVANVKKVTGDAKKGLQRVYYGVASKKYADCPVCKNPVKAPEDATVREVEGAEAAENQRLYDLQCKKCQAQFPIML